MLPQTNADLLSLATTGDSADYDYEGGADVPLWSGVVDAYYSESARLESADGKLDRTSADTLIIDNIGDAVPELGGVVTFRYEGVTYTRKITAVGKRPSLPGVDRTFKLYMESV